ncbi:MAG: YCF48-related protein [Planctomycetota bacterium]
MQHTFIIWAAVPALFLGCRQAAVFHVIDEAAWAAVQTGSTASLRGLAVVDAQVVWIGGAGGTLRRTVDGGHTWQDVAPPGSEACDFRDIEAFDAETALAMVAGQPARVYRTTDGGNSWKVVHEDVRPEAFFDAMAFDGERGALFGDPIDGAFCVSTSDDRGVTWQPMANRAVPRPVAGEAAFAASGTCVAFGPVRDDHAGRSPVLIATGGGASRLLVLASDERSSTALPLLQGAPSQGAFSLAFAHANERDGRGVVVGGDYQDPQRSDGTAAWTEDGGRTWHPSANGAGGYRSAVVWIEREQVLAVGSHGASVSSDGGRTWRPFGSEGYHSVGKGDDGRIWACGSEGRVARLVMPGR